MVMQSPAESHKQHLPSVPINLPLLSRDVYLVACDSNQYSFNRFVSLQRFGLITQTREKNTNGAQTNGFS